MHRHLLVFMKSQFNCFISETTKKGVWQDNFPFGTDSIVVELFIFIIGYISVDNQLDLPVLSHPRCSLVDWVELIAIPMDQG